MAFNLKKVLKALLYSSSQPLAIKDIQAVFERFHRVHRPGAPGGSGLGLAIARGFVEASRGTIAIASPVAAGRGTALTIRLPLAPPA